MTEQQERGVLLLDAAWLVREVSNGALLGALDQIDTTTLRRFVDILERGRDVENV